MDLSWTGIQFQKYRLRDMAHGRPLLRSASGVLSSWLVLWALIGGFLWQEHQAAVGLTESSSRHLSFVMAELVDQSLTVNRLVVDSMIDWLAEEDVSTEADYRRVASSRQFYDRLTTRTANLSQIEVATFIALDGTVLNFTRSFPPREINLADRDYFLAQTRPDAPAVSLGNVVQNRGNGAWTFYLAKTVYGPTGEKLGVAIVGVRALYYADMFRRITEHSGQQSFLLREDGALLTTSSVSLAPLGSRVTSPQTLRTALAGHPDLTFDLARLFGTAAESARSSSISPVGTFPAYIVVVATKNADPTQWRDKVTLFVTGGTTLSLLMLAVGWRNYHRFKVEDNALRQEGERRILSTIFNSPITLAALVDSTGHIVYRNERFATLMHDFIRDHSLVLGHQVEGASAFTRFLDSDQVSVEFVLCLPHKNGRQVSLRFTGTRVDLGKNTGAVALVGYDDTRRAEADARIIHSSKLITLGEMATSMAHELNQPLNVIKMAGQSALFEIDDFASPVTTTGVATAAIPPIIPFIEAKLQRIVDQVDRAAIIIDHMRIFGRVPRGLPPVVEVSAVCRAVLRLLVPQLRDWKIRLEASFENGPLLVKCHSILLEQVLANLILNARDALLEANTTAPIIQITGATEGQEVSIVVSDNGPGVAPEIRDRLFEPFFTTKLPEKGTGLGLAVSYGIVRDSGGRLELLSESPGCSFRISLPAAGSGTATTP